jgi:hypothetical protein
MEEIIPFKIFVNFFENEQLLSCEKQLGDKVCSNDIITKYVLPICSEHNYIFSHRIVHWVYNYKFRPCILAIVRRDLVPPSRVPHAHIVQLPVKFTVQPDDGQYTGPKHVVVY